MNSILSILLWGSCIHLASRNCNASYKCLCLIFTLTLCFSNFFTELITVWFCLPRNVLLLTLLCAFLLQVSVFHKPLERESQCAERRDALMQLLYQTLFLHIVSFINSKISTHRNKWSHFMGKFFLARSLKDFFLFTTSVYATASVN